MIYQQDESVVSRQIGEDVVLVPVRRSVGELESIYTLNGPGAELWECLAHPQPPGALAQLLVERYEVAPMRASADVLAFLAELASLQLVRVSNGPEAGDAGTIPDGMEGCNGS